MYRRTDSERCSVSEKKDNAVPTPGGEISPEFLFIQTTTTTKMHIYNLRVRREQAGKVFPFDRVYLAKNGDHKAFKKLFRYALIMPVEQNLKNLLLDYVKIDRSEAHPFDRDEHAVGPSKDDWQVMLADDDWVMCVPILSKYIASNMPRYITAAGRYRAPTGLPVRKRRKGAAAINEVRDPFPTLTYLQTPEKNIRPVCVACPRFIMHQNGQCRLGEDVCYSSLALGVHNHFEEGLKAPLPSPNELVENEE